MNLFGTDGIRGKYNDFLTNGIAYALGKVIAHENEECMVVIGRDTRESGEELATALAQGVFDNGGEVINMGIVPTNAVAHYVLKVGADYGVMISASHNPPEYNGLKVFDRYGVKICKKKQVEFSEKIAEQHVSFNVSDVSLPIFADGLDDYEKYLEKKINCDFKGRKVALDCCYGSAYKIAEEVFARLNAKVVAYCNFNKGKLINVDCGATETTFLERRMKENGCELGFAFDGDADRLAVFEGRTVLPPDRVFFAFAKYFYECGQLNRNTVVGTILTNSGLEKSLKKIGIDLERTDVGDSKIYEKMLKESYVLGGENSGHYLLGEYATGSDAVLNALLVAKIYCEKGSILEYTADYKPYFSLNANFVVDDETAKALRADKRLFSDMKNSFYSRYPTLRLVARISGTEPKIRLFVEGKNQRIVADGMEYLTQLAEGFVSSV